MFKDFTTRLERATLVTIERFHSDAEKEHIYLQEMLEKKSILQMFSTSYISQSIF